MTALKDLADAAVADARAAVMRGHRAVGTGRVQISVEGPAMDLGLAQWAARPTATLSVAEVEELIARLTTGLAKMKASAKLAKQPIADDEEFA